MRNNKVRYIAFSSMFTALSVIVCLLASFFSTMSITITAVAGVISAITLASCGYKYAFLSYFASAILVFLFVPNRECAVYYIMFFGNYPIIKAFLERITGRVLRMCLKLVFGNLIFAASMWILLNLVGIQESMGNGEIIALIALFNVALVLYDILLGRIIAIYIGRRFGKSRFR